MRKRVIIAIFFTLVTLGLLLPSANCKEKPVFLIHLKTALKKDDAQICVAYNMIWAALEEGFNVKVLVDASAIDTFKIGWLSKKDDIEDYKIPDTLRDALSKQFNKPLQDIPKTYGEFIKMLHRLGAVFYVNSGYLMVSKAGTPEKPLKKISMKFFKPISLRDMIILRREADYYMAY